jgi:hypothetical protein
LIITPLHALSSLKLGQLGQLGQVGAQTMKDYIAGQLAMSNMSQRLLLVAGAAGVCCGLSACKKNHDH